MLKNRKCKSALKLTNLVINNEYSERWLKELTETSYGVSILQNVVFYVFRYSKKNFIRNSKIGPLSIVVFRAKFDVFSTFFAEN